MEIQGAYLKMSTGYIADAYGVNVEVDRADVSGLQERLVRGTVFGCGCPAGAAGDGAEGGEGFEVVGGYHAVLWQVLQQGLHLLLL